MAKSKEGNGAFCIHCGSTNTEQRDMSLWFCRWCKQGFIAGDTRPTRSGVCDNPTPSAHLYQNSKCVWCGQEPPLEFCAVRNAVENQSPANQRKMDIDAQV